MKKKLLSLVVASTMSIALLGGCGSGSKVVSTPNSTTEEGDTKTEAKEGTEVAGEAIRIVNGKIEVDQQLKAFAKQYGEKTGQEVIIESLGGGVDINGAIKGYFAAGNMPDIFVFGGEGDYQTWKDHMLDLSNEEWVANTDFGFKAENGDIVGFPYAVEGYGITYNADILEKAGVDPSSLTNYSAYKAAFEKIDGMKAELGIDAVASIAAESGQMFWSTGNHIFGYYLSLGLERGDTTYIDMLQEGKIDEARMGQFADYVKLLYTYSDPTVLISGTYDDQLALWAQGKTAFITQGNWIDPSLPDYNVTFNAGIAPLAFLEEETTGVLADSPSWWAIFNKGKNIEGTKAFLNDLAISEEGQNTLVIESGMISPYENCTVEPNTPLAVSLKKYVDKGNTYAWEWTKMPEGIAQNTTGGIFELYAKDEISKEEFVKFMGNAIADYAIK
ncbi:MAG TPA: ABC transporter substrate-binding protein [Epulopiscium sp.]|nr:ABC transporter substrate-binding protein [Candidatus Epulonipiscium sp.]